jgi:hypothetical protein
MQEIQSQLFRPPIAIRGAGADGVMKWTLCFSWHLGHLLGVTRRSTGRHEAENGDWAMIGPRRYFDHGDSQLLSPRETGRPVAFRPGCASLGSKRMVYAWRSSAAIHADHELLPASTSMALFSRGRTGRFTINDVGQLGRTQRRSSSSPASMM